MIEYVHVSPGEEIEAAAGCYQLEEGVLEYKGELILYVRSQTQGAIVSCCGSGCLPKGSVFVKGRLIEWKSQRDNGKIVSRLEPVTDPQEQQEIRKIIQSRYPMMDVYF